MCMHVRVYMRDGACACACAWTLETKKKGQKGKKKIILKEGRKEGRRREGPNRLVSTGLHVVETVSEHRSSVQ